MREETRMQSGGAPSSGSCCSELQRDLGLVCAPQSPIRGVCRTPAGRTSPWVRGAFRGLQGGIRREQQECIMLLLEAMSSLAKENEPDVYFSVK